MSHKDLEKRRQYQQEYRATHRESISKFWKEYCIIHKEERRKYNQQYHSSHKERLNEKRQKYCISHREQIKQYNQEYQPRYIKTHAGKYRTYKASAKQRGLSFVLSFNEFMRFWQKPCAYCKQSIDTIGLDRVDNSRGYELDNLVSCCSICNYMKKDLSYSQFIAHIGAIMASPN